MFKKMQWRFIEAVMSAITVVVLVLLIAINFWNYNIITIQQDETLKNITNMNRTDVPGFTPGKIPMPGHSPEAPFMLRFFVVHTNKNGEITGMNHDYIASVSEDEAAGFTGEILEKEKQNGYYKSYRFLVSEHDKGRDIIFLNVEKEINSMKTLFIVSVAVAALSLLVVFVLVIILSKRALNPYIKNIENQKRFITDASHELKTPLTSISTSADILAMEHADDEWVQNIRSQSARMGKLITNLVALSRLDEEQPLPERQKFSISDAIWEISEPFSTRANAENKEYVQHIEDGIIFCGDKNAVQQMVSVLLDNAIRYSCEHGKIQLDVCRKGKRIEIIILNTCESTEQIDFKHIFDRFYRPDNSRNTHSGGTGIGLSIARATAEAHGGKITARPKHYNGIEFFVIL